MYFMLWTRIKCSHTGAMYGCFSSQYIPVGDPFHQVGLKANIVGSCAWNKPGKVNIEILKGR